MLPIMNCSILLLASNVRSLNSQLVPKVSNHAAELETAVEQGVRPASLQRIVDQDLIAFITRCISPRNERPRARNLLKHPYFDSIRQEKCAQKLSAEALAADGRSTADLVAEVVGSSVSRSASRSSSFNGSSGTGAGAYTRWPSCAGAGADAGAGAVLASAMTAETWQQEALRACCAVLSQPEAPLGCGIVHSACALGSMQKLSLEHAVSHSLAAPCAQYLLCRTSA